MKPNLKGMTLIEILVAITLLIVIVMGFVSVFSWGIKGTIQNKNVATAMNIAQNRMERLKNESYEQVATYTTNPEIGTISIGTDYNATLKVESGFIDDPHDGLGVNDNDTNPNDYLKGTITVSWIEGTLMRKRTLFYLVTP